MKTVTLTVPTPRRLRELALAQAHKVIDPNEDYQLQTLVKLSYSLGFLEAIEYLCAINSDDDCFCEQHDGSKKTP